MKTKIAIVLLVVLALWVAGQAQTVTPSTRSLITTNASGLSSNYIPRVIRSPTAMGNSSIQDNGSVVQVQTGGGLTWFDGGVHIGGASDPGNKKLIVDSYIGSGVAPLVPFHGKRTGVNAAGAAAVELLETDAKTAADEIVVLYRALDSASASVDYAKFGVEIGSPTAGATRGIFKISAVNNGSMVQHATATSGNFGAGASTPTSTLFSSGSFGLPITTKTGNYTLTASDFMILADANSGSITQTLPTAVSIAGRMYTFRRIDTNTTTSMIVATTSSQTIGGNSSVSLAPSSGSLQVISDGSNWRVLNTSLATTSSSATPAAPNPLSRRVVQLVARGSGTVTIDGIGDAFSSGSGTQSAVGPSTTEGPMVKWSTAASVNARAGWSGGSNYRRGRGNTLMAHTVKLGSTASSRVWVGFSDASFNAMCDAADPASANIMAFRFDTSASDTTWRAITKDGTTLSSTDTGIAPTTSVVRLEIEVDDASNTIVYRIDGVQVASKTSNLPATSADLKCLGVIETIDGTARDLYFAWCTIASDR